MASRALLIATSLGLLWASGCPGAQRRVGPPLLGQAPQTLGTEAPAEPPRLSRTERVVVVDTGAGEAKLGAELVRSEDSRGPGVVLVPGGSDISRRGARESDGVTRYQRPVEVYGAWAEALAARGAQVLAYDKRTCGKNDSAVCTNNPQQDVDAEGPVALAKDVDAACALLRAEASVDGRVILFAHGQGAQVALSSTCAQTAAAVVLLAPIPRGIDLVLVDALKAREQALLAQAKATKDAARKEQLLDDANKAKNAAATRAAGFASMKSGKFEKTARIDGATLAFWLGWIALTEKTPELSKASKAPLVVVLGSLDAQYGATDRGLIEALGGTYVPIEGADHHLLTEEALAPSTVDAVGKVLDGLLASPNT